VDTFGKVSIITLRFGLHGVLYNAATTKSDLGYWQYLVAENMESIRIRTYLA